MRQDSTALRPPHARHPRRLKAITRFGREPPEALRDQQEGRAEVGPSAVDREGPKEHPARCSHRCRKLPLLRYACRCGYHETCLHPAEGRDPEPETLLVAPLSAMLRDQPATKGGPGEAEEVQEL
jgi:hypothetical protein